MARKKLDSEKMEGSRQEYNKIQRKVKRDMEEAKPSA